MTAWFSFLTLFNIGAVPHLEHKQRPEQLAIISSTFEMVPGQLLNIRERKKSWRLIKDSESTSSIISFKSLESQYATGMLNPFLGRFMISSDNFPFIVFFSRNLPVRLCSFRSMGRSFVNWTTSLLRKGTRTSSEAAMLARSTLYKISPSK